MQAENQAITEFDDDEMFEDEIDAHSDSDSEFLEEESLLERIGALVDIVPPTTRQRIANAVGNTVSFGFGLGKTVGSGLWILCTGALLVVLPVSLELERDAMAIQQEFQQRGVQQEAN
jgi:import receptor subunit TOM22